MSTPIEQADAEIEAIAKELQQLKMGADHLNAVAARADSTLELSQTAVVFAHDALTTLDAVRKQLSDELGTLKRRFSDEVIPIQVSTNFKVERLDQVVTAQLAPVLQTLHAAFTAEQNAQAEFRAQAMPRIERVDALSARLADTLATVERGVRRNQVLLWLQFLLLFALGTMFVWSMRAELGLLW